VEEFCAVAWLASLAHFKSCANSVLARSWNVELQTLTEDLVEVEARTRLIEANVLARELLVVKGAFPLVPLSPGIFKVILHFITHSELHFVGAEH